MFKIKKSILRRKFIWTLLAILFIIFITIYLIDEDREYGDNQFKIGLMKRSIKSPLNSAECKIPNLPVYNDEIMKFYYNINNIDCGNPENDWVTCKKSICFVKPEVLSKKGEIVCSYTDVIRKTDFKIRFGKTVPKTKEPYILKESDFAKAICYSETTGEKWFGLIIGIRDSVDRPIEHSVNPLYNVLMVGFDSLSRNAFIRKLPKTYDFLTKNMSAQVLKGYNIIGDGTPQALVPILTGYTELELPDTRKRKSISDYVNIYPFIWNDFQKHGYITAFNEDLPETGVFTYRLNGFLQQPTDHYMRTFYVESGNYKSKKFCLGQSPSHQIWLDYTKNFMETYSENPKFGFSFHGELSHDSINDIGAIDDDLLNWLDNLKKKHILDNTIFILMSDHGNRFAEVRNTLQGKQEERLPFFSLTFPESFKSRHPHEYKNLVTNVDRLTTPFDIYATLYDILRLQKLERGQPMPYEKVEGRAISLFNQIPKNRSCSDAFIEPHWCACLNWKLLKENSVNVLHRRIALNIVETINNFTQSHRSLCHILELAEINWIMKLQPNKELIQFKKSKDIDGFVPDLSSFTNTQVHNEMYQMKITVKPGDSMFEASTLYNKYSDTITTNLQQISRINKYGTQANCIYDTNPELRKYCYCRDNIFSIS